MVSLGVSIITGSSSAWTLIGTREIRIFWIYP
jgi:hypothetical protein